MRTSLKRGQVLRSHNNNTYIIKEMLGSGGQGEVFRVASDKGDFAVKWYFSHTATEAQFELIKKLVAIGPPNKNFLWPTEIIRDDKHKGFGYVMKLRSKRFKSIVDLMKRRIEPSFYTLTVASIQMVDSFEKLHNRGLCYRDISFGNIFFDDRTGEILICDNDNVTSEKHSDRSILGTPRFMAPEVVRGDALPNIQSDLFSLSILLFYMFMIHHPLEGKLEADIKCFDLPAMKKLYGSRPVFIFDPINRSNRPVEGLHDNANVFWGLYPEFMKYAFTQSFTKGLNHRYNKRIYEKEWKEILIRLKNSIMHCSCGAENFYDLIDIKNNSLKTCWACGTKQHNPPRMKINKDIIILNRNTKLFKHHISNEREIEFNHILGMVNTHPSKKDVIGLTNNSREDWHVKYQNGKNYVISKGKTFTLENNMEINFGSAKGFVRI